jgi:hypothetical protein
MALLCVAILLGLLTLGWTWAHFGPHSTAKSYSTPPTMGQLKNFDYLNDRYGAAGEKACEAGAGAYLRGIPHLYDWESNTWDGKLDEVTTWVNFGTAAPGILLFSSHIQMLDKNGAVSQFSLRLTCKYDTQADARGYPGQEIQGYSFEIENE